MASPVIRCAIFTRKSSDESLDQSFNSLDAQRESCVAYIDSQKHQGWTVNKQSYDDGGFSGGTMQRPALKQLLDDISSGKVDTVIVYNVDRLTRSLTDFAKIIEVFDSHQVSFVSVTQQFNTTSSMGRLTLNVLLSFAQFERELTGERIRDKLVASKKKGMWMGGVVQLGYDRVNQRLVVNPTDAETVREIFRQYLRLGCVTKLRDHLEKNNVRSKVRESIGGRTSGGSMYSRGALYHLLSNRIYIGEIIHRENSYSGQHEAIVSRILWDRVAARLKTNGQTRKRGASNSTSSLLTGIVFDTNGVRFTPTHAVKNGKRYRYYTSQAVIQQRQKNSLGTRIPAQELDDSVLSQIRGLLRDVKSHISSKNLHATRDVILERARTLDNRWDSLELFRRRQFARAVMSRVVIGQDTMWIDIDSKSLHGLKLIRRLVDHAISFNSGWRNFGTNAITITSLDGGEITFPWVQSYSWSRDLGSGPVIVTSALMALEAWAHRRLEGGEPFDKVLADVIGPANAPAAYLLVVIDLLLSHWPKSRVAAIPFLASPELLCLECQRMVHDNIQIPDIFGIEGLQKEPAGAARLESLKARASRRSALDQLLAPYALDKAIENQDLLTELLRLAASRLGPPKEQSDLGDPEFMVVHALNLIDRKNWKKKSLQTKEGFTDGWEYVSPETETQHLQPLQDASRDQQVNTAMQARITLALNNPAQSSPAFEVAALIWAKSVATAPNDGDTDQDWIREEAIVAAAMIAARDGGAEVIAKHDTWIRATFMRALKGENDPVHRMRAGLQFNPIAIAFVGMILLLKNRFSIEDVRTILEVAGDDNPAAAHGFAAAAGVVAAIDERLPRAILRCALAARVQPRREWNRRRSTPPDPRLTVSGSEWRLTRRWLGLWTIRRTRSGRNSPSNQRVPGIASI